MDIWSIFLDNPGQEFHVREVARLTKKSPTTVSNKLKKFKKESLLTSKKERNHLLYKANTENKSYRDLKFFYNLKNIRTSGLIDYLNEYYNYPSAIILFGSFRKADNISSSDIDLCVITSKKEEPKLDKFEKKLKHKIQLFNFSKKEFIKQNPQLMNNIINGFVLECFLEVFE